MLPRINPPVKCTDRSGVAQSPSRNVIIRGNKGKNLPRGDRFIGHLSQVTPGLLDFLHSSHLGDKSKISHIHRTANLINFSVSNGLSVLSAGGKKLSDFPNPSPTNCRISIDSPAGFFSATLSSPIHSGNDFPRGVSAPRFAPRSARTITLGENTASLHNTARINSKTTVVRWTPAAMLDFVWRHDDTRFERLFREMNARTGRVTL